MRSSNEPENEHKTETLEEEGFARAERITKARAKSFAFASHVLGPECRRGAFAVYAFCRGCDDAVDDERVTGEVRAKRIGDLRERAKAVYQREADDFALAADGDPLMAAFRATVRRHHIPFSAVSGLLDGMERDLEATRYQSMEDLESYCQQAAGTVGIMMASIFDARSEEALNAAAALGRAMQLTNVLRDVREDLLVHDRVYLPAEMLAARGLQESDLRNFAESARLSGPKADSFRSVMRTLAGRARALYAWADRGIPLIPRRRARACVRLMRSSYAEILSLLEEADWDPFRGLVHAPLSRKLKAAAREAMLSPVPMPIRRMLFVDRTEVS